MDLTPREKGLYREFLKKKKQLNILKRKVVHRKRQSRQEKEMAQQLLLGDMQKALSPAGLALIESVVTEAKKQAKGRRRSVSSKLVAPSLLKKGPNAYQHLRSLFPLPLRSTLIPMLNSMPFKTG
jgi:hypothetical protein